MDQEIDTKFVDEIILDLEIEKAKYYIGRVGTSDCNKVMAMRTLCVDQYGLKKGNHAARSVVNKYCNKNELIKLDNAISISAYYTNTAHTDF